MTLPAFPDAFQCILYDGCLGIECCVNLDLTIAQLSTRAWVEFDVCNYKLSVGLGSWYYNVTLFSYEWGTEITESITEGLIFR